MKFIDDDDDDDDTKPVFSSPKCH